MKADQCDLRSFSSKKWPAVVRRHTILFWFLPQFGN